MTSHIVYMKKFDLYDEDETINAILSLRIFLIENNDSKIFCM